MAKRVNTRFLLLLTILVVIGGMTLMAARVVLPRLWKADPQALVLESQRLEAEGQIDQAIAKYQSAVRASMKDPVLRIGLGDLYDRHVAHDVQNLAKARDAWGSALLVDAGNREAMRRLLDAAWGMSLVSTRAETLNPVRDAANRVLEVDPDDAYARSRLLIATVRGAEADVPTRREDLEAAATGLRELAGRNPADAEVAWWAGRAELRLAAESARAGNDLPDARARMAALEQSVDAMRDGQPANAAVQFRAAQLYIGLAELDRSIAPRARPRATAVAIRERAGRFTDRIGAALEAARANVKPSDPDYAETQLLSAEWLTGGGKPDEGLKLLDEMIAARPDDSKVRLGYARMVRVLPPDEDSNRDRERRARVLEVLSRPVDFSDARGTEVLRRRDYEGSLLVELANVRLVTADGERDKAQRKQALETAREDVERLEALVGGQAIPVIELKGRLAHANGNLTDAIALLQHAVDRRGEAEPDYDVIYQLATAYLQAGQTGQAEKQLRRVVSRFGGHVRARALLIRTLLADGQAEAARTELAELRRRKPEAPELAALSALVEGGKAREAFVEQMPEKTPAHKVRKAVSLRNEGKADEAVEMARAAFKQDPSFMPAVELLLDLYLARGQRDEAVALTGEAVAANPGNASLSRIAEQLDKKTPAELEQWRLEQIEAEPDAFARALKLFDFHLQRAAAAQSANDEAKQKAAAAEAERRLEAAERLKPADLAVTSRRFELLLVQRRFEEAGPVLERLAEADTDRAGGAVLRFRLAAARDDLAAAETAARDIARQRPEFAEGYQRLGQVLQVQGRNREALDAYTEALDRQGRNYAALRGAIEMHLALNKPAEAEAALDRARALFPRDATFRELALNHELRHGDPARVVAERERLHGENPDSPEAALTLAETYLLAEGRRQGRQQPGQPADVAKAGPALAKARKVLEDGVAKWPGDVRFRAPLARVINEQGDFAGGERVLKVYADREGVKGTAAADLLLADYYANTGKLEKAEQSLRDAVTHADDAGESAAAGAVRQRLAALLATAGRHDQAVRELAGVAGPIAARQRVQYLLAGGKTEEAELAAREAVAANPDSTELSDLQIQILIDGGRFDEAREVVQRRTAGDADDATARYFASLLKLRTQPSDVAGAIAELTEVVNRNPGFHAARALLAEAQWAGGETSAAIDELGRVLENDPLDRDVRAKLIEWCAASGRWDAALKLARDAAENPATAGDMTWMRAMARAQAAMDQVDEAERTITTAIARATPQRVGELQRDYLSILLGAKRHAKVLELTDKWLAAKRAEWWLHQARGLALQGTGDAAGAVRAFDAALAKIDPVDQYAAADAMVRTVAASAGLDVAIERVLKWVHLDPRWRVMAADLYITKDDAAGAVEQLEPALAEASQLQADVRASVYRVAGLAYHQLEPTPNLAKATALYEQYLQLRPKDAAILNNIGYLLAEEMTPPNPARAKGYSQRAYEIARDWKPGEPRSRVLDTHGWVLVLNGSVAQGIRILEEVVEDHPILEAHYHLGEAHLREKRAEESAEQLHLALKLLAKAKEGKQRFDPQIEQRVHEALERVKALDAAARAR